MRYLFIIQALLFFILFVPTNTYAQTVDVTSKIENIGNPAKARWADNTSCVYARNVWDLQVFGGKVYIGSGNSANNGPCVNAGPVSIYSYDPLSNTFSAQGISSDRIDQEQVDRFVIIDNQLITPAHDPRGTDFPSWFRLESGNWVKYTDSTKNIVHNYDIYKYGTDWFLAGGNASGTSQFNRSIDSGKIWSPVNTLGDLNRGTKFFELNNNLYGTSEWSTTILGARNAGLWKWNGTSFSLLAHTNVQMFPGVTLPASTKIPRALPFMGNIVYIGAESYNDHQFLPLGLYKSSNIESTGTISKVVLPRNALPWDMLLGSDGALYILASVKQPDNTYINTVIKTTDLTTWQEIFYFSAPTYAHSFEKLDNDWYFGLGTLTSPLSPSTGDLLRYKIATPSPSGSAKPGDIVVNGAVDIFDYNELLRQFGMTGSDLSADIEKADTSANKVDIFDFNKLLGLFGS